MWILFFVFFFIFMCPTLVLFQRRKIRLQLVEAVLVFALWLSPQVPTLSTKQCSSFNLNRTCSTPSPTLVPAAQACTWPVDTATQGSSSTLPGYLPYLLTLHSQDVFDLYLASVREEFAVFTKASIALILVLSISP